MSQPANGWTHLDALEAESIFILREVAAKCANVALLFSGGKDSAVVLRLAERAFFPEKVPFTLLHVDTEHNFPEVIAFRDRIARERDLNLVVRWKRLAALDDHVAVKRRQRNRLHFVERQGAGQHREVLRDAVEPDSN